MSRPWRALIVGCGRIAGGYNRGPGDAMVLTHALAYHRHPGCILAGCVDPDEHVRIRFAAHWDVPKNYAKLDDALGSERFDIISVCTPTGTHLSTLRRVLQARPLAVLAEKPLDARAEEARRVGRLFNEQSIPVAVNFTRRFDKSMHALRQSIREGRYGALDTVVGWYGKGVVNNASHLIDLVRFLTDREPAVEGVSRALSYGVESDRTVTASLNLGRLPFQLIGLSDSDGARFELELTFADAVVTVEDGGMTLRLRTWRRSEIFAGERELDRGNWQPTAYGTAMLRALDELRAWRPGSILSSDIESAAASIEVADALRIEALETFA